MNINTRKFDSFLTYESRDSFLEVKDIKKGDVIYECDSQHSGVNFEFRALINAEKTSEGWECLLENREGEVFEIFVSGKTSGVYLPQFYRVPQYFEEEQDGEFYYPVR